MTGGKKEIEQLTKRRIKDLLSLQFSIVSAINEEIEWCLLGRESDVEERIKFIVDEKRIISLRFAKKEGAKDQEKIDAVKEFSEWCKDNDFSFLYQGKHNFFPIPFEEVIDRWQEEQKGGTEE